MLGTLNSSRRPLISGVDAFVHAGSSSEYGFKDHPPGEKEWLEPNSYYAVGKAAATLLCRYVGEARRLRTATLRLYSVYGPWEDPGRLVPRFCALCWMGGCPRWSIRALRATSSMSTMPSTPSCSRLKVPHPASTTSAADDRRRLRQLVQMARRIFAVDVEPQWGTMERRSWDATVWVADPRRAQEELGWAASRTIDDGLRLTADWLQSRPEMRERYAESQRRSR